MSRPDGFCPRCAEEVVVHGYMAVKNVFLSLETVQCKGCASLLRGDFTSTDGYCPECSLDQAIEKPNSESSPTTVADVLLAVFVLGMMGYIGVEFIVGLFPQWFMNL